MPREIFYTFNASAPPADPTVNSTKYTTPLTYPVGGGYYKAIAREEGVVTTVTSASFERSPTDYIHYYPFTTDFNDTVGTNNFTNYGVTIANNKAVFNSSSDLLVLGSAITSSAISLVLTIKFSSLANSSVIFNGVSINYNMLIIHNGKLAFYSTGWNDSTFTPALNTEYKLCLIKNGTNVKLYVDGVKYLDSNNGISNATEQFKNLGNVGTGQQLYSAQGEYSQFKIFNRAVTESEAIQLTTE